MAAISQKLRATADNGLVFMCPGCKERHIIHHGVGNGPRWQWNGDAEKPTFSPSVLVRWTDEDTAKDFVCHSFVTAGKIQFLNDSTHDLAGKTVDLPDFTEFP